jgi:23S rRNA (adenine2030-N6)-methyltransferase
MQRNFSVTSAQLLKLHRSWRPRALRRVHCATRRESAMNYRHRFHAGNFADVLKHAILLGVLDALQLKPAPFAYLDTHAGSGVYALDCEAARKTGEFRGGIARVIDADDLPPLLRRYVGAVRVCDASTPLTRYPGSPWLAQYALRTQDRAVLCELLPDEATALRGQFHGDARMQVHQRDGYEALPALLPPPEKRGLVLIDPPFEAQKAEFKLIQRALATALSRWSGGMFAVWYPIKLQRTREPFLRWLRSCAAQSVLVAELAVRTENSPLRMNGCGVALLNPPWKLDQALSAALPVLARLLGEDGQGDSRLQWLKRE